MRFLNNDIVLLEILLYICSMEKEFKIKTWTLRKLALLYFPNDKPKTAQQKFAKWLRIEPLRLKLELLGWKPYQKVLTPKQVACIIDHVGEPDLVNKLFDYLIKKEYGGDEFFRI